MQSLFLLCRVPRPNRVHCHLHSLPLLLAEFTAAGCATLLFDRRAFSNLEPGCFVFRILRSSSTPLYLAPCLHAHPGCRFFALQGLVGADHDLLHLRVRLLSLVFLPEFHKSVILRRQVLPDIGDSRFIAQLALRSLRFAIVRGRVVDFGATVSGQSLRVIDPWDACRDEIVFQLLQLFSLDRGLPPVPVDHLGSRQFCDRTFVSE